MRFCSSFCYTSTQIKCCWLSQHKARFRSKCMHSQSLYYQAKPSPCQASLLKREKKLYLPAKGILCLTQKEAQPHKGNSLKSKDFTGGLDDLEKAAVPQLLSEDQWSANAGPLLHVCFQCKHSTPAGVFCCAFTGNAPEMTPTLLDTVVLV